MRDWIANHAAEAVKTILETQKESMRALIARGNADNLTVPQIAKSIRKFYEDNANYLSMRVARSECATAAGYGQSQAAKQLGANTRTWLSSRDDRVRPEHQEMDGESTDIDGEYSNGMAYVGDPAGGPDEIINCRCAEQFTKA